MLPGALKNTDLRKLLLAQVPADFADWLDFVAIGALLAFVWEAPTHAFALLAIAMGLPYLVIGPVAGALVDRLPLRSVLVQSNLARGVATAALFLAPGWPVLLALVALRSSVDTFFTPAKQAALQALTPPPERAAANGLSHAINQASKIAAPGIGGSLLVWLSPGAIFLLNAGVSLLAALLSARIGEIDRAAETAGDGGAGLFEDVAAGWSEMRANAIAREVMLMMSAGYFSIFVYDTFIAPLTRDLGFEPRHLGWALAAVGGGGVIGSAIFGFAAGLRRPGLWIAAGMAISGASVILLGAMEISAGGLPLALYLAIFGLLGLASAMSMVPFRTILQDSVPEARMGRITALSEALNTLALLTAPLAGAALASAFSMGAPFLCGGLVMLLVAMRALTMTQK